MTDQIFVSHSKEDTDLLERLDSVFGKSQLKQYRANFEDQTSPVSKNLKDEINRSMGMFVVLGRRAQAKTHTMIWIGWEAGVAIQSGVPVWILEDIQSNIRQPIPSFTDYILWDSKDDSQIRVLRDVIESEFVVGSDSSPSTYQTLDKKERGLLGSQRNNADVWESEVSEKIRGINCPYIDCGEKYVIRFEGPSEFNCPSCRQPILLDEDSDTATISS